MARYLSYRSKSPVAGLIRRSDAQGRSAPSTPFRSPNYVINVHAHNHANLKSTDVRRGCGVSTVDRSCANEQADNESRRRP